MRLSGVFFLLLSGHIKLDKTMTLQQLEYIMAVYRLRHFAKAADYCDVTQPTPVSYTHLTLPTTPYV